MEALLGPSSPPHVVQLGRLRLRLITDPRQLSASTACWTQLAARALEPNSFYEPWFFLPAIEAFDQRERWAILVVETDDPAPNWLGFFPFVHAGRFPVPRLALWRHPHTLLTTPLLDHAQAHEALGAVVEFLSTTSRLPALIELPQIAIDGPFRQLLVDIQRERLLTTFHRDVHNRALLRQPRPGNVGDSISAETYLQQCLGGHHLRELRRQRRRLADQGMLELRQLRTHGQIGMWVEWFLDLESRGWKGREGTAMLQLPAEAQFFRKMVASGFKAGRIEMLGLFVRGEPIALKCNLLASPGSFSFKIAFDEQLARCSPGVQLETDHLNEFLGSDLEWMDSCAVAEHKMINRIWKDRRTIANVTLAVRGALANVYLGALPLARSMARLWKSQHRHCDR
ncbi:MAG: GNAT family N-acetyltransferase [Planctomycetaceae bacterium]|nr:GNAT family N-acetyltransferase [Planctomycetaceae bacterium]